MSNRPRSRRPVTLFTGQWADLSLAELAPMAASWGFDGLELACWGDHVDVERAAADSDYCEEKRDLLRSCGLGLWAIGNHLVGQAVCDPLDDRHRSILPPRVWGGGDPSGVRDRAIREMKLTARAAANLGVKVVTGFTGSPIWHLLYSFPPVPGATIEEGFREFARLWRPILDEFEECDVAFALEVHPTEIAFDSVTAARALDHLDHHAAFRFNFDPSHLAYQGVDPADFVLRFGDRISHVHVKDVWWSDAPGKSGVFGGHLPFGHRDRHWDFRSPGRGKVDFEEIFRALHRVGYEGPLSVEWEDSLMDREHGAAEALRFVRDLDFPGSDVAFDDAFSG